MYIYKFLRTYRYIDIYYILFLLYCIYTYIYSYRYIYNDLGISLKYIEKFDNWIHSHEIWKLKERIVVKSLGFEIRKLWA